MLAPNNAHTTILEPAQRKNKDGEGKGEVKDYTNSSLAGLGSAARGIASTNV
jgi:hypothetical protein